MKIFMDGILRHWATAIFAAAAMMFGSAAIAQEPGQTAPAPQQSSADFSDEKVAAFVDAQSRVVEVSQKLNERLQNITDPEEVRKAQQSAHKEMVIAVETSGLTVEEYNNMAQAAQNDPELAKRIQGTQ